MSSLNEVGTSRGLLLAFPRSPAGFWAAPDQGHCQGSALRARPRSGRSVLTVTFGWRSRLFPPARVGCVELGGSQLDLFPDVVDEQTTAGNMTHLSQRGAPATATVDLATDSNPSRRCGSLKAWPGPR